tara:strand:+ start:496 stop:759 length:264 start_codon:yes stop_codon:yes gene_type:complete
MPNNTKNKRKTDKKKDILKQNKIDKTVDKIRKEFFSKKYNRPIDKNTLTYTKKEEEEEPKNLCLLCNIDMGINNPRQLCGKTKCLYS